MGKLTFAQIKWITNPGRYGDGNTLFLHVAPGGSKSWVQRLTVAGKARDIGLGGWPLVSLAEARGKAFDNRKIARSGGDPLAGKRRAKVRTFEAVAREAHKANRAGWRSEKHAFNWLSSLERYAFPVLGADAGGPDHGSRRAGRPGADLDRASRHGPAGAGADSEGLRLCPGAWLRCR